MKKIFSLLVVLITGNVFSQSINVDTTTYTPLLLINDVLINSPCISATNPFWRTGTSFGSSNGIGYFTNSNPNFPMSKGVILSTGDVSQAVGPNTTMQSNGNTTWVGDPDIENELAAYGMTTSTNATILQFEFVAESANFGFKYLFASEEYGNTQCQFSDGFAFFLTDLTAGTPTINLAKIPSTNIPISVATVRDFAYNSGCPSANPQYFGLFNGGSNSSTAATNFEGQTVPLQTLATTLIPGNTYRIKLVIADRLDYQGDSAIFLEANSFNVGQEVLGSDRTSANNTDICPNQTTVLNTNLSPLDYTFVWKKGSLPGTVISGQTGPTLTVSTEDTYTVICTNIATPCKVITDSIFVQYKPVVSTPNAKDIFVCDAGQPTYTYDLSYNTPKVTVGQPLGTTVSYHISLSDANNNVNPLPLSYVSAPNTTIYARINNPVTGCYKTKSFDLLTSPAPVANPVGPLHSCAIPTNPTKARFNLSLEATPNILLAQLPTEYTVRYFSNMTNATNGTPALATNYTSISTTIYARIQSISDASCYNITPIQLIVDPIPAVTILTNVTTCNSYPLPTITDGSYYTGPNGTGLPLVAGDLITTTQTVYIYSQSASVTSCSSQSSFKVTIVNPANLTIASGTYCNSYTLPNLTDGEYRDAPAGGGTIIPPGTTLTANQTVYYYFHSLIPTDCTIDIPFTINITTTTAVANLPNVFECVSYTLPPLTFGDYYHGPNATGGIIPAGTVLTTTSTIHIYGLSGTCPSESSFKVIIGTSGFPTSTTSCTNYTLPTLEVGQYYYGPNGTGGLVTNPIISTQGVNTIYVYVSNTTSFPNCTANYSFTVTKTLPALIAPTIPSVICDTFTLPTPSAGNYFTESHAVNSTGGIQLSNNEVLTDDVNPQKIWLYINNGSGCEDEISFDVLVNKSPIVDNRGNVEGCNSYELTPLINGNYYSGSGGTGIAYNAGDLITTPGPNTIYIYANNNGCTAQNSFVVTIFDVTVTPPAPVEKCDSYSLPTLPGTQKYYTLSGGPTVPGNIQRLPGFSVTTTQTLYIYDESSTRNWCYDEKPLSITINNTPVIVPVTNINVCESYTLPALSVGKYYTAPHNLTDGTGGGTVIADLTTLTTSQTVYIYAESGTSPLNCRDEKSFTVNIYNVDELIDVSRCFNDPYILPVLTTPGAKYYNGTNGTGGIIPAGTAISTTKTIYIRGNSGAPANCFDETDFTVTISQLPVINGTPLVVNECDNDGINDGVKNIDLTTLTNGILLTQTGVTVTYHATQQDADDNVNLITSTEDTIAYVRVSNDLLPTCFITAPINITINRIPEPTLNTTGIICKIQNGTNYIPMVISSGLNSLTHDFQWSDINGPLLGETNSNYTVSVPGTYSVIAKSKTYPFCESNPVSIEILESIQATVSYTVNEDFSETPVLTIIATGFGGNYEYQLDGGPFQDSPIFYNAVSGTHEMTVKDKNGCGETTVEITVINFQRFFTPNGDGSNDIWNIYDLYNNNASISIYDRYGKFITKITPSSGGWDGTFNGEKLPASDYWFIVKYKKDSQNIEYKSHFSLKR